MRSKQSYVSGRKERANDGESTGNRRGEPAQGHLTRGGRLLVLIALGRAAEDVAACNAAVRRLEDLLCDWKEKVSDQGLVIQTAFRRKEADRRTGRGADAPGVVSRSERGRLLVDAVDDGLNSAADGIEGGLRKEDKRERRRVERDLARPAGAIDGDRLLFALERAVRSPRAAGASRLARPCDLR